MRKIRFIISLALIIALCAAGLPAQKAQAAENTGLTVSDELARPVITTLKNGIKNICISWSKVDGADYYCVYRQEKREDGILIQDWIKIGETDENDYLDLNDGYDLNRSYVYRVRAVKTDDSGNKILSPVSAGKLIHRLSKPTFTATNGNTGISVRVRGAMGKKTGIIVYRKGPGETSYTRIAKVVGFKFADKDVIEGESYSYKICTYRGGSKSAVSKVKTITREKP